MEELRDLGGYVFGTNRCWRTSPRTGSTFQGTDFHTFVSGHHFDDLMNGRVKTGIAFMPARFSHLKQRHHSAEKFADTGPKVLEVNLFEGIWNSAADGRPWSIDFDRGRVVSTFAGHLALALACYLGFDEIILVGYDANDGEGHFFDRDDGPRSVPIGFKRDQMVKWFDAVAEWILWEEASRNVRIVNTNPDSAIKVFPFVTKEELLNGHGPVEGDLLRKARGGDQAESVQR